MAHTSGAPDGRAGVMHVCCSCEVRIERENGDPVGSAWGVLTEDEAFDLLVALAFYFRETSRDPGWHHHVGEGDQEFTVAIEPEPAP